MRVAQVATLSFLFLFSGCAAQNFGVRPDDPPLLLSGVDSCATYLNFAAYVQKLETSYYVRSNVNRAGSYAAGTVAVGSTATSAGLAIEDAANVSSMGFISVAQAALGALFNVVDNPTLASIYTVAANDLSLALDESFATLENSNNPQSCFRAHIQLRHKVTLAKNNLELARTDSSSAALQRALSQVNHYNDIVKKFPVVTPVVTATMTTTPDDRLEAILTRMESRINALESR